MSNTEWMATGRRKSASARVRIKPGTGNITVNKLKVEEYFGRPTAVMVLKQPLELTEMLEKFDVHVNVVGGGRADRLAPSVTASHARSRSSTPSFAPRSSEPAS